MTMYELTTEYSALVAEYEAAEDDARRAEVLQMMDALQDEIGDKGEAYARVLRNMEAAAAAYRTEAQRLLDKARAQASAAMRLKEQLLTAMKRSGATKLQTSIGTWTVQRNPWSAEVMDASAIPAEFHIPQPDKIDRQAIIRHFKATGEIVDGVMMNQDTGLRFR